jgi:membrane associated rhomboid family serine protease
MSIAVSILILLNLFISYKGMKEDSFFDAYVFEIDKIRINREYVRLISSSFLHLSWPHLLFNMFSLYAFGTGLEISMGPLFFLIVYFLSAFGGDLLSLFIHRNDGSYRAAGASGAVCGIIFACIALNPGMSIGFFFIPIGIPAWIYGIAYILYTIYGIHSKRGNVGHDAHLGGALLGMIYAVLTHPETMQTNLLPIALILVTGLGFILLIIQKPEILVLGFRPKKRTYDNIDEKYNLERKLQQEEIDAILDKIARKGIGSLTTKEKQILDNNSRHMKS